MEMSKEEDYSEEELDEYMTLKVDPGQGPVRIDKYLIDKLVNVSRNKVQLGISSGAVTVNDKEVKSNYKVRPHDQIRILLPRSTENVGLIPEDIPLDMIYEDQDILIVNKQAGMVVHPGIGNRSGTLVNALLYHIRQVDLPILAGNPDDRPGLVHRIDKNTSGLLVVAKNDFALNHLAKQFYDHTAERLYQAIIWGQPEPESGTLRSYLGRDRKDRRKRAVCDENEGGKLAVTHYKIIEPLYYVSHVECKLETGRTHQIRVHMSHHNHPLFGDSMYGGDVIRKGTVYQKYKQFVHNCFQIMPYHALHAGVLGVTHPTNGERLLFQVDPPQNFMALLEKWRNYVNAKKES